MLKTSYLEGEKRDSIADTYVTKTLRKLFGWVGGLIFKCLEREPKRKT